MYHNGIARFRDTVATRPPGHDTELGRTNKATSGTRTQLLTTFNDLDDAANLIAAGGLMKSFGNFLQEAVGAEQAGRLGRMERLTSRKGQPTGFAATGVIITVLGPLPTSTHGPVRYDWFTDESHTSNGHSVTLRLDYDQRSYLLPGDLNSEAQQHLIAAHGAQAFRVDGMKACHHGSSDFDLAFIKAAKPAVTVFSSGDNENYAHPAADALGSAGRWGQGQRPLIFSTELARSYKSSSEAIHWGVIHVRTDGQQMVAAQLFEKRKAGDQFDAYVVA
jgi:hypothetical protein